MATLNEYREELWNDFFEAVEDYVDPKDPECFESVFESLEDSVTGNDNGSYYCNRERARQALSGIVCDEEFHNILSEYGEWYRDTFFNYLVNWEVESADVIARCLILDFMYPSLEQEYYHRYFSEEDEEQ